MSDVDTIKRSITIFDVGKILYPNHKLSKSCHSPFRQDNKPSFSVFDNGRSFKDFGTGEGGDVITFYRLATGVEFLDAITQLSELNLNGVIARRLPRERKKELEHPVLESPTRIEINKIAKLRSLSSEGVALSVARRFLFTGDIKEHRAWILTDDRRVYYAARRLDGEPWRDQNVTRKCYTLHGSKARWPIGALDIAKYPCVALVEGGPDLLAAHHFIYQSNREKEVGVVCMSASSIKKIVDTAWMGFKNKRVRIFAHNDEPGRIAGECWKEQLARIASYVDIFDFGDFKDLNEAAITQQIGIMKF